MTPAVKRYPYPDALPVATEATLEVEGVAIDLFELATVRFAHWAIAGPVDLTLRFGQPVRGATVRPTRLGVAMEAAERELRLHVREPADLCIDIPGERAIFLYIDGPEPPTEPTGGAATVRFEAGRLHEVGTLSIDSDQTVVIEPGAIVRGVVRAAGADRIRVTGRGILDGGCAAAFRGVGRTPVGDQPRTKLVQIEDSRDVLIEGVTMIRSSAWMCALAACDRATVRHVRQLGEVVTSDGIDIVGSRHVHVHDCCLRNNDDCIAVKAIAGGDYGFTRSDPARDVHDLLIERCTLWNDHAGNAMEIGFETRCEQIRDVTFRDIDVIGAHGHGGVFTIHAGDRAHIHRIRYEDIRVEHLWDRMIDFQIMRSRYSKDADRGRISDVSFRDLRTIEDIYNTLNILAGRDDDHRVDRVRFDDCRIGDRPVTGDDDLALLRRHAGPATYH